MSCTAHEVKAALRDSGTIFRSLDAGAAPLG
jgi:hypothetical protein